MVHVKKGVCIRNAVTKNSGEELIKSLKTLEYKNSFRRRLHNSGHFIDHKVKEKKGFLQKCLNTKDPDDKKRYMRTSKKRKIARTKQEMWDTRNVDIF